MPKIPKEKTIEFGPYWTSRDKTINLYHGHIVDVLQQLPPRSVQTVITSPPYWGLRDYQTGDSNELGSEKTPELFVENLVNVFREIRRVLRRDGTVWLNLGDTYGKPTSGGESVFANDRTDGKPGNGGKDRLKQSRKSIKTNGGLISTGVGAGNLLGMPWRVALALQADGWILRQDIIWCLSGGTWVYARTQKGDAPMMLRDIARLDPSTVELWNGKRWTRLLGISRSKRRGNEIELVLRSGEKISCTPNHKFPTQRGLLEAGKIKVGDRLDQVTIPQPDEPKNPDHITLDSAWLAGVYLAEGCGVDGDKVNLSGHVKEVERWNRVLRIAQSYGATATLREEGNKQTISIYGKVVCAVIRELVGGHDASDKYISPTVWKYGNNFVESFMLGYLHGDGGKDSKNRRHRLGFTRNDSLARDIRVACARLGWCLTLNPRQATFDGRKFPCYKGEIRFAHRDGRNFKDRGEIVAIQKARCREVYDVGVADDPHLFALASGVLTHNSKPSPMPESVTNRCTKAHEYLFLISQQEQYFYDQFAIREVSAGKPQKMFRSGRYTNQASYVNNGTAAEIVRNEEHNDQTKNKRSVWADRDNQSLLNWLMLNDPAIAEYYLTQIANKSDVWKIASKGYKGAHFATFPPDLVLPCLLAGTSEHGACAECGSPYKRIVDKQRTATRNVVNPKRGDDKVFKDHGRHVTTTEMVGWEKTCICEFYRLRDDVPDAIIAELQSLGLLGIHDAPVLKDL